MVRCASEAIGCDQHCTRAGTQGSRTNLDGCCSSTRAGSPQREWRHQTFDDVVRLVEHQTHRRTMDTEYISRASRALAAMTLVRQAAASEIAVHPGTERETWIDGYRAFHWTAAGWITVVIVTCLILVGLVLRRWKSGIDAETIDNGTQTLEKRAVALKNPPPSLPRGSRSRSTARPHTAEFFALSLQNHTCDPISELVFSLRSKRRSGKARLEAAHWVMRTSFERQSLLCQFPVSQIPVPQLYTRLPCCNHPDHDAPFQRDTCDRSMCKGSDRHQCLFSYPVVLVSVARDSVAVFGTLLAASHPP